MCCCWDALLLLLLLLLLGVVVVVVVVVAAVVVVAVVVVVVVGEGCGEGWPVAWSSLLSWAEPLSLIRSETGLFHFRSSGAWSTSMASPSRSCPIARE